MPEFISLEDKLEILRFPPLQPFFFENWGPKAPVSTCFGDARDEPSDARIRKVRELFVNKPRTTRIVSKILLSRKRSSNVVELKMPRRRRWLILKKRRRSHDLKFTLIRKKSDRGKIGNLPQNRTAESLSKLLYEKLPRTKFMSPYVSTPMPRKITYWNIHKRISGTIITSANRHHEFYYPLERSAPP